MKIAKDGSIHAKNLTKCYKKKEVSILKSRTVFEFLNKKYSYQEIISGVSFEIKKPSIIELIGPNGAGKTTLLRTIAGLLKPDEGSIRVGEYNPYDKDNDFLKQISYLPANKLYLDDDLTPYDSFLFNKEVYGIKDEQFNKDLNNYVEYFESRPFLHIKVKDLSTGERAVMEIVYAFLHKPRIVLLDEPLTGLDFNKKNFFYSFIRKYHKENNSIIFFTHHNKEEIGKVSDRLFILKKGRLVFKKNFTDNREKVSKLLRVIYS